LGMRRRRKGREKTILRVNKKSRLREKRIEQIGREKFWESKK
jgi:hypothetical protein